MARVLQGPDRRRGGAGGAGERRGQAGAAGGDGQRAGRRGLAPACWPARRRSSWSSGSPRRPRCGPRSAPRAPACSRTSAARSASWRGASTTASSGSRGGCSAAAEPSPATTPARSAGPWRRGVVALAFTASRVALRLDALFNLAFTALAALVTLVDNAFGGGGADGSNFAIAVGSTAWLALGVALPGRLLVAGRADAGDALRRHPARPARGCRCGARSSA